MQLECLYYTIYESLLMNFKKYSGILVILIICLTLIFIWFSKGLLFAGGEGGIPFYNLSKTTKTISYTWIDEEAGYPGVGGITEVPYYSLLKIPSALGVSPNLIQALHFFIVIFIGAISCYFLIKITLEDELKKKTDFWGAKYVSLTGAIFYLLNPFSMTQIFGRSLNIQYLSFALLPLFLLLFIKGLKDKNLFFGFLALIPSVIFAGAYGSYGYVLALWFLVSLYSLFHIWNHRKKGRDIIFTIIFFLFLFAGWMLLNLFWILPVFKLGVQQLSSNLNALEENLGSLRGVSKQFPPHVLIRLMHTGYFYEDLYGKVYSSFIFVAVSWVIPIVSLFSIQAFKKLTYFKFYLGLFLISLFISLGSNFPTGWLFELLFTSIPYFQIFRNPYEKFGLIFLLAYIPFFAIGVLALSEKIAKLFRKDLIRYLSPGATILLVCGIFVWPMWTGIFAGGYRINTWIKVPDYYKEANNWLNQQGGDFRLLHLPLIPGDGIRYKWDHPYQGIEPSEFLFNRSSIAQNIPFNKAYYNVLLQRIGIFQPNIFGSDPDLTDSEFRSENLWEELAKLNIRYIILHNDIDITFGGFKTPQETAQYLANQDKVNFVKSFGQLDIYKVDISKNFALIYSDSGVVSYEKVNPTLYKAEIVAATPTNLYFLMRYSPNWEAYIDGEKIENHFEVFSYANGWRIDKKGTFQIDIKYKPQQLVNKSATLSIISALAVTIVSFIYLIIRWKTKKI